MKLTVASSSHQSSPSYALRLFDQWKTTNVKSRPYSNEPSLSVSKRQPIFCFPPKDTKVPKLSTLSPDVNVIVDINGKLGLLEVISQVNERFRPPKISLASLPPLTLPVSVEDMAASFSSHSTTNSSKSTSHGSEISSATSSSAAITMPSPDLPTPTFKFAKSSSMSPISFETVDTPTSATSPSSKGGSSYITPHPVEVTSPPLAKFNQTMISSTSNTTTTTPSILNKESKGETSGYFPSIITTPGVTTRNIVKDSDVPALRSVSSIKSAWYDKKDDSGTNKKEEQTLHNTHHTTSSSSSSVLSYYRNSPDYAFSSSSTSTSTSPISTLNSNSAPSIDLTNSSNTNSNNNNRSNNNNNNNNKSNSIISYKLTMLSTSKQDSYNIDSLPSEKVTKLPSSATVVAYCPAHSITFCRTVYNVATPSSHLVNIDYSLSFTITDPLVFLNYFSVSQFDKYLHFSLGDAIRRRVRRGQTEGGLAISESVQYPGIRFDAPVIFSVSTETLDNPSFHVRSDPSREQGPRRLENDDSFLLSGGFDDDYTSAEESDDNTDKKPVNEPNAHEVAEEGGTTTKQKTRRRRKRRKRTKRASLAAETPDEYYQAKSSKAPTKLSVDQIEKNSHNTSKFLLDADPGALDDCFNDITTIPLTFVPSSAAVISSLRYHTIPAGYDGISSTRDGQKKDTFPPGIHKKATAGQKIRWLVSRRFTFFEVSVRGVPLADALFVSELRAGVLFRVTDPIRFVESVSPYHFDSILRTTFQDSLLQVIQSYSSTNFYDIYRQSLADVGLLDRLNKNLSQYGVSIFSCCLADFDVDKSFTQTLQHSYQSKVDKERKAAQLRRQQEQNNQVDELVLRADREEDRPSASLLRLDLSTLTGST